MRLVLKKDLAHERVHAKKHIDEDAELVRSLFITPGSGQALVYQQKRAEAELVSSDPEINPALVPHIAREADLNGISLLDQAAIVLTMAHQWTEISSMIEERRLAAKAAIDAARTPAEIEAVIVDWSDIKALAP